MMGLTHAIVGASLHRATGHWWLAVPLAFMSHGFLDASAVYHEYPAWAMVIWSAPIPFALWWAWRNRVWPGMIAGMIPDLEWAYKVTTGLPAHPILPWQYHRWAQLPSWNYLGVYGSWLGIPLEIGLVFGLWWYMIRAKKRRNWRYGLL